MNTADEEKGLMACVHCGFCLDACPTYRETGDEADSPRGRIVLMRGIFEGKIPLISEEMTGPGSAGYHLDRCLGCRACETACPSGVPYGALLENVRDKQEKVAKRSINEKILRTSLLTMLTQPPLLKAALIAGRLTGGAIPTPLARFVGLPDNTRMPIPKSLSVSSAAAPVYTHAQGGRRGRAVLLTGCVMSVLYGPVHAATVRVLAANGVEVIAPPAQPCCGALHGHQGEMAGAIELAKKTIAALEGENADVYISNSAGCGSFLKEYGKLLKDDAEWNERAAAFSAKVKDVSEYLSELGPRPMTNPINARVTYHDACHLAHGQRITSPPRQLIKAIPGVTFVEAAESDLCCGSAGVYNYLQPKMARNLLRRKVANLLAVDADIIVTGNPGCLAWIQQGVEGESLPAGTRLPEVVHPVELLDRAYAKT
jgi:glycolate oxidase iron-sulfur subunit